MSDEHDDDNDGTAVWALSPSRLAVLWVSVAVGVVVLGAEGWHFAVRGVDHVYLLIVAAMVVYAIVTLLRGVVAVAVDPLEGSVLLFRAAGPDLRTRVEHVQRIEHGRRQLARELSTASACAHESSPATAPHGSRGCFPMPIARPRPSASVPARQDRPLNAIHR